MEVEIITVGLWKRRSRKVQDPVQTHLGVVPCPRRPLGHNYDPGASRDGLKTPLFFSRCRTCPVSQDSGSSGAARV